MTYFAIVVVHKPSDKVSAGLVDALDLQIVACGTILIERKFIRGGGRAGHIEDIAVSRSMQGRKLGLRIIKSLEAIGRTQGCYKIILDCSKENIRKWSNNSGERY